MTGLSSRDLAERLRADGFLLLPLDELAGACVSRTLEAGRKYFPAHLDLKMLDALPNECGYRPTGIEYSQNPDRPDQVESFTVSPRISTAQSQLASPIARALWQEMLTTFAVFEQVAELITVGVATMLANQAVGGKLHGAFHCWSRLQANYSRPADVPVPFINELHEDGTLLTIALANAPGLELRNANNEFVPCTTRTSEVLIMPGEIMWLLSGGQIPPLYHRVRPDAGYRERLALLFFGDIDPVFCEPWISNDVNAGIDIGSRVLASATRFGLKGFHVSEPSAPSDLP